MQTGGAVVPNAAPPTLLPVLEEDSKGKERKGPKIKQKRMKKAMLATRGYAIRQGPTRPETGPDGDFEPDQSQTEPEAPPEPPEPPESQPQPQPQPESQSQPQQADPEVNKEHKQQGAARNNGDAPAEEGSNSRPSSLRNLLASRPKTIRFAVKSTARRLSSAVKTVPQAASPLLERRQTSSIVDRVEEVFDERKAGERKEVLVNVFVRFKSVEGVSAELMVPQGMPAGRRRKSFSSPEQPVVVLGNTVEVMLPAEERGPADGADHPPQPHRQKFTLPNVLPINTTQEEVFVKAVTAHVTRALDGFHSVFYFYGETGAGKSWTMLGPDFHGSDRGVVPRAAELLFEKMANASGSKIKVSVSFAELYKEKVTDLLNVNNSRLFVKESKRHGPYVEGLKSVDVTTVEHLLDVLKEGRVAWKLKCITEHERRNSHTIFDISVRTDTPIRNQQDAFTVRDGQMRFVELAGSERPARRKSVHHQDDDIVDIKLTMQGLVGLNNVIRVLGEKGNSNIPYKSSTLTHLLRRSWGGNASTTVFLLCSPDGDHAGETIRALDFGKRASAVTNVVRRQVYKRTTKTEEEVARAVLREELKQEIAKEVWSEAAKEMDKLQEMHERDLESLTNLQAQAMNEEIEQLRAREVEYQTEMQAMQDHYSDVIAELRDEAERVEDELMAKESQVEELENQIFLMNRIYELEQNGKAGFHRNRKGSMAQDYVSLKRSQDRFSRRVENKMTPSEREIRRLEDELTEREKTLARAELQLLRIKRANRLTIVQDDALKIPLRGAGKQALCVGLDREVAADLLKSHYSADLETMRRGTFLEQFGGYYPIPQSALRGGKRGYLLQKLHGTDTFVRSFFVVQDCTLLQYEGIGSDVSRPQLAVYLEGSHVGLLRSESKPHSFVVVSKEGDRLVFVAPNEEEKHEWISVVKAARHVTHRKMVELAVATKFMLTSIRNAEEREKLRKEARVEAFALFENLQYVAMMPLEGTHVGWFHCSGYFRPQRSLGRNRSWHWLYFVLQGAHLWIYNLGVQKMTTQPAGIFRMVGCTVERLDHVEGYQVKVSYPNSTRHIVLRTHSKVLWNRWILALQVATRISHTNMLLLAQIREAMVLRSRANPIQLDTNSIAQVSRTSARALQHNSNKGAVVPAKAPTTILSARAPHTSRQGGAKFHGLVALTKHVSMGESMPPARGSESGVGAPRQQRKVRLSMGLLVASLASKREGAEKGPGHGAAARGHEEKKQQSVRGVERANVREEAPEGVAEQQRGMEHKSEENAKAEEGKAEDGVGNEGEEQRPKQEEGGEEEGVLEENEEEEGVLDEDVPDEEILAVQEEHIPAEGELEGQADGDDLVWQQPEGQDDAAPGQAPEGAAFPEAGDAAAHHPEFAAEGDQEQWREEEAARASEGDHHQSAPSSGRSEHGEYNALSMEDALRLFADQENGPPGSEEESEEGSEEVSEEGSFDGGDNQGHNDEERQASQPEAFHRNESHNPFKAFGVKLRHVGN